MISRRDLFWLMTVGLPFCGFMGMVTGEVGGAWAFLLSLIGALVLGVLPAALSNDPPFVRRGLKSGWRRFIRSVGTQEAKDRLARLEWGEAEKEKQKAQTDAQLNELIRPILEGFERASAAIDKARAEAGKPPEKQ